VSDLVDRRVGGTAGEFGQPIASLLVDDERGAES